MNRSLTRACDRIPQREAGLCYRCGTRGTGCASWLSVGDEGACILLDGFVRPGRHMILVSPAEPDSELVARIVWCRPSLDGRTFVAGVRLIEEHRPAAHVSFFGQPPAVAQECVA